MRHVMGVTASEPGTATEKAGSDSETKARYSRRIGHSLALLKSTSTDNARKILRFCVLRCGRAVSFGCAIALRSVLKKSWKGPAFAASVAVNSVEIDNQTTIVWRRRFTKTASCQPFAMRVLEFSNQWNARI